MDHMVYTLDTFKVKDFGLIGVSYASCGPTSSGGGWKGSGQDVTVHTPHYGLVSQLPALLSLYNKKQLYKKRGTNMMIYSIYKRREGTQFPKD